MRPGQVILLVALQHQQDVCAMQRVDQSFCTKGCPALAGLAVNLHSVLPTLIRPTTQEARSPRWLTAVSPPKLPLQDGVVELGVLGCPNLPQGAVDDEDGGAAALDRATTGNSSSGLASAGSSASWGALFLGHRGRGAYMADLYGKEVRIGFWPCSCSYKPGRCSNRLRMPCISLRQLIHVTCCSSSPCTWPWPDEPAEHHAVPPLHPLAGLVGRHPHPSCGPSSAQWCSLHGVIRVTPLGSLLHCCSGELCNTSGWQ
jgi:hypothetical protein